MIANSKIFITLFYSAFLLIALNGNGQTGFNTYYQSGFQSSAVRLIEINSNQFLVVSYFTDSIFGGQGIDLRRIDLQGQTLQHKRHLFTNAEVLSFINDGFVLNLNSSTLLLSACTPTNGLPNSIVFASINKTSLDTNWVRFYSDSLNYYLNNLMKISSNELWLFGNSWTPPVVAYSPYALKIDTLGNIIGKKVFPTLANHSTHTSCYDAILNKLFLSGHIETNLPFRQCYCASMDTSGNIGWLKSIGTIPNKCYVNQIERKNNYLVLAGSKQNGGEFFLDGFFGFYKSSLLKLDASNGNLIWEKTYGDDWINNSLSGFTINNDESITAVGAYEYKYQYNFYTPINLNTNAVILKTGANGDSLWMHTYSNHGVGKVETFQDIQPTSDGGYIMCGAPHYANPCHSWVVKTDSMGLGSGMYPVGVEEFQSQGTTLMVYPNPARNDVRFDIVKGEMYEVLVFNHLGQTIMHLKHYENNTSMSVANLHSGLYNFVIRSKDKTYTGKFVKE